MSVNGGERRASEDAVGSLHESDESFDRMYAAQSDAGGRDSRDGSGRYTASEFSSPEAEINYWKAEVDRDQDALAATSPRLLDSLLSLGNAYVENAQFEEAEPVLLRVQEQMVKIWGWDHVCSQLCVEALRRVLAAKGDLDGAQKLYGEALAGVRRVLGSEHPWTSQLQNNYACICMESGDFNAASDLLRAAVRAKSTVFGPEHGITLISKCNLALVSYLKDGFYGLLESSLRSIFHRLRESWGEGNADTVAVAKQLISLYFENEEEEMGNQLCQDLALESFTEFNVSVKHYDHHIPLPGHSGTLREEETSPELKLLLSTVGAEHGETAVRALNWTREKVMKWTGMGVTEFADLIGIPRFVDWGHLTDAKELLKEAAILGHEGTVRMLLEKRRKLKDDDDLEPEIIEAFHYSCFYGNEWVARLCLEHVSDVDVTDAAGQTGLHKAARQGHEWVALVLLESGAMIGKEDDNGRTPLDEALRGDHDNIIRLFMIHRGALVASSKSLADAPVAISRPTENTALDRVIGMNATLVEFFVDTTTEGAAFEEHRVERKPVETLLWDEAPSTDSSSRGSYSQIDEDDYPQPDFKWIHLPANNMAWVEALMAKVNSEQTGDIPLQDLMKRELWTDKQHESTESAVHSRFMKPSCRPIIQGSGNSGSLVVFLLTTAWMPYIHWELEEARNQMAKVIKDRQKAEDEKIGHLAKEYIIKVILKRATAQKAHDIVDSAEPDVRLIENYLFHKPPLHIRRTLDQFHYYTTDDTDFRDSDQVISRYMRRKFPEQTAPIMMVDQLWLWVVNNKTVITAFPQRWGEYSTTTDLDTQWNMTNILDSVLQRLEVKDRNPITSAFALSQIIMACCLGLNFDPMEWHHERYRHLEIFEYSINYVADEETRCFNRFADGGKRTEREKERKKAEEIKAKEDKARKKAEKKRQKKERNRKEDEDQKENLPGDRADAQKKKEKATENIKPITPTTLGEELEDIFDISREIELLKEIKDIRDELNILRNLFDQQKRVLDSFCVAIETCQVDSGLPLLRPTSSLLDAIQRHIDVVASLDEEAKRPYKALEDLLDLKQKQANVSEARIARISGNTITVFTVVTIIFLPASFMAAFLALPIAQYPKSDSNFELSYAIKYTTITTAAMAIPFVILAVYVNPLLRVFQATMRTIQTFSKRLSVASSKAMTFFRLVTKGFFKGFWMLCTHFRGVIKMLFVCFMVLLLPFMRWKLMLQWFRSYRKAKSAARTEGKEWSKRRYLISKFIDWRKRRQEEKAEDVETQSAEEGLGRVVEIDDDDDSGRSERRGRRPWSTSETASHPAGTGTLSHPTRTEFPEARGRSRLREWSRSRGKGRSRERSSLGKRSRSREKRSSSGEKRSHPRERGS